jgi:Xaa-Pro dipeptidase
VRQGVDAVFSRDELATRIEATRRLLHEKTIDVLVCTGPENIFYLTGQQTPGYYTFQALLLPVEGEPVFLVRRLELYNLLANTSLSDVRLYDDGIDPLRLLVDIVEEKGWQGKTIAIDKRGWFLPIAFFEAMTERLGRLADGAGIVESLRAVKTPAEIAKIEAASRYVDAGMRAGIEAIRVGGHENEIVARMMGAAIAAGSEYVGMEPLVASGARTGIPHGTWKRRRLEQGDPIFLELAACHDRYHAALMRSAWIGRPRDDARRMMDVCLAALDAALAEARPGSSCERMHQACQRVIDQAGDTENYRKRSGYSIGIAFAPDWGEWQVLSIYDGVTRPLVPGMVFHVPPALRIYGEFTVGVSETIVITESGCRALSSIDRDLVVI